MVRLEIEAVDFKKKITDKPSLHVCITKAIDILQNRDTYIFYSCPVNLRFKHMECKIMVIPIKLH